MFSKFISFILLTGAAMPLALAQNLTLTSKSSLKEIDAVVAKIFSTAIAEEKREEARAVLEFRKDICRKSPAECFQFEPMLPVLCKVHDEKNDALLLGFWEPVLEATTTEAQASKLWSLIKGCARSPTTGQLRAFSSLTVKAATMKWASLQSEISKWAVIQFKNQPKGSLAYSVILLARAAEAFRLSRPIDFEIMGVLATPAATWIVNDTKQLKVNASVYESVASLMHALSDIGKMSLVRGLFDSLKLGEVEISPDVAMTMGFSYCSASRQVGKPKDCLRILDRMVKPSSPEQAIIETSEVFVNQGLYQEGYQAIRTLGLSSKPEFAALASIFTGVNALYLGKIDEAREQVGKFIVQVRSADIPAAKLFGPLYQSKILMFEGKFSEAWAKLEEGRLDMEKGTHGAYRARMLFEYQSLLLAAALRDESKKAQSLNRLKASFVNDPSEEVVRQVSELVAKKAGDRKALAEIAAFVSRKHISDVEVQDLKKIQSALSK